MKESEEALAGKVVSWLDDMGWTVYQEVQTYQAGPRADIVAIQGQLVWIVECKLQFGFNVLDQALHWIESGNCHYCSIATPITRRNGWAVRQMVCTMLGIGVFQGTHTMTNIVPPRLHRRATRANKMRECLTEDHRTFAAAGTSGTYWSPFKATLKAIREVLAEAPEGLTMRQIVDGIRHHYSSDATARSCLHQWIRAGKVPMVIGDCGHPERFRLDRGPGVVDVTS